MDDMLKIMMRRAAWHRAKGELHSILEFFAGNDQGFDELRNKIEEFTEYMEKESPIA